VRQDQEPFPPITAEEFDALAASPAVAEMRFTCVVHGTEAGVVRVQGNDERGWMVGVDRFVCKLHQRVHPPAADELRDAIAANDVRWVHLLDVEWAPFFCLECGRVYCGECWRTWEVFDPDFPDWVDQVRGTCPRGHERMLSD